MPEVDGLEATRRLRAQGYRSLISALTAHSAPGERSRCLVAGCDEFLTKPISPRQLVEAARQLIEDSTLQV